MKVSVESLGAKVEEKCSHFNYTPLQLAKYHYGLVKRNRTQFSTNESYFREQIYHYLKSVVESPKSKGKAHLLANPYPELFSLDQGARVLVKEENTRPELWLESVDEHRAEIKVGARY